MTEIDEKNKPKPKSLLTIDGDASKILEESIKAKEKKAKKIEIIGGGSSFGSSKKEEAIRAEEGVYLTKEEQALRAKIVSEGVESKHKSSPGVAGITVVQMEDDEKLAIKSENLENEGLNETKKHFSKQQDYVKNKQEYSENLEVKKTNFTSNHVIKSSFEVKAAPLVINEVDKKKSDYHKKNEIINSLEEEKKAKKKTLDEEARKNNFNKNWKNAYSFENDEDDEEEEEKVVRIYPVRRKNKKKIVPKEKIYRDVDVYGSTTIRELSSRMSEKPIAVLKFLKTLDSSLTADSVIDIDTCELVVNEFGHRPNIIDKSSLEGQYFIFNDKLEDLKVRPPIVTIMGHVDHGKTTLLDAIRNSKVADSEHGGITQHIGAYQVKSKNGKLITFFDTPGHEAFSQIRARGSQVTDIAIIVVAADDGIKPQTVESINHALAANVPIIIAINKIDKPDSNLPKVKADLLQHNIVLEELGGDILSVEISAKNNLNIDKLLEAILLQAEMLDLKTNPQADGLANIIEVKQEKGFGFLATVLVERGTLKLGDHFVCGQITGKIKVMINDKGERLKEAPPATPVEISGFNGSIEAGDRFIVVKNELKANELANYRKQQSPEIDKPDTSQSILDILVNKISEVKTLAVIIKTDTQGTLEAIKGSLNKIEHKDVEIKIVHSAVGEITESDVMLSKATGAVIFGFNARANTKARDTAKKEVVDIRYHSVIYKLIDDIKLILTGLLDPDIVENIIGYAEVREAFNVSNVGKVAGCYVKEGILKRSAFVRVLRNNIVIHDGNLSQLKRFKDDVKEVRHEYECGVVLDGYNDIQVGDLIECYDKLEVKNKID